MMIDRESWRHADRSSPKIDPAITDEQSNVKVGGDVSSPTAFSNTKSMDISPVDLESVTIPIPDINLGINVDTQNPKVIETSKAKKRLDYAAVSGEQQLPKDLNEEATHLPQSVGFFNFGTEKAQPVSYAYSFEAPM